QRCKFSNPALFSYTRFVISPFPTAPLPPLALSPPRLPRTGISRPITRDRCFPKGGYLFIKSSCTRGTYFVKNFVPAAICGASLVLRACPSLIFNVKYGWLVEVGGMLDCCTEPRLNRLDSMVK